MLEIQSELKIHPPIVDTPQTPEEIVQQAQWEIYPYSQNTIAGAVVHWGYPLDNNGLYNWFQYYGIGDLTEKELADAGFEMRYVYPSATTSWEAAKVEKRIGIQLIKQACKARGITPQDLSLVFVVNTSPGSLKTYPNDYFGEEVSEEAGVRNEAEVINVSLACGGVAESTRLVGEHKNDFKGEYAAVVSVEGLTKISRPSEGQPILPLDLSVFTNGGAAYVFKAGEDFEIIPGKFEVLPDDGTITAPCYYTWEPNDSRGLMIKPNAIRQKLPNPNNENFGHMDGRKTLLWAKNIVVPAFDRAINTLRPEKGEDGKILSIIHHPSKPVFYHIPKRLQGDYKMEDLNFPWLVDDGNASSATLATALLRAGNKGILQPGRDIFCFGFGVGGNCSSFILRFTPR